jgi:hypothetical protein
MRRAFTAVGAVALLASTACYHVVVDTGRPPSPTVIDKPWAPAFLGGLVPPEPVDAAAKCPNGVSKVESQMSFPNLLASFLTSGLYTPMTITVTCAAAAGARTSDASTATLFFALR